jgi:hypothetical protein
MLEIWIINIGYLSNIKPRLIIKSDDLLNSSRLNK